MENVTLGQIGLGITFIVGLVTGIAFLYKHIREWVIKVLKEPLDSINGQIKGLGERVDRVDLEATKNYLVAFLAKVEKGHAIDEIERERFWEQYQHYTTLGGNSYIKHKVEQLKANGKL